MHSKRKLLNMKNKLIKKWDKKETKKLKIKQKEHNDEALVTK